jgi:hypothetical protein
VRLDDFSSRYILLFQWTIDDVNIRSVFVGSRQGPVAARPTRVHVASEDREPA